MELILVVDVVVEVVSEEVEVPVTCVNTEIEDMSFKPTLLNHQTNSLVIFMSLPFYGVTMFPFTLTLPPLFKLKDKVGGQ